MTAISSPTVCFPIFIFNEPVENHERRKAKYEFVLQPSEPLGLRVGQVHSIFPCSSISQSKKLRKVLS
jgi:hypothetical protein